MKLNQKGAIDMMLVAAIAVVLIVGGFVLYRINDMDDSQSTETNQQANQDTVELNTDEESETEETTVIPEGWVEYTNKELGISFAYPEEWGDVFARSVTDESLTEENYPYFGFTNFKSVYFGARGPDYEGAGRSLFAQDVPSYTSKEDGFSAIFVKSDGSEYDLLAGYTSTEVATLNSQAIVTQEPENEVSRSQVSVRVNTTTEFKGVALTYYVDSDSELSVADAEMTQLAKTIKVL